MFVDFFVQCYVHVILTRKGQSLSFVIQRISEKHRPKRQNYFLDICFSIKEEGRLLSPQVPGPNMHDY